jgi:DNA sulfur modification protein DndD
VAQGDRHQYYIERSWTAGEGNGLKEFFKAEKKRKPLDDVSPDHWQSFVADIVPERLAQLFFFDGKKIKSIAEDITSNAAISDAIQTLLGLPCALLAVRRIGAKLRRVLASGSPG